MVLLTRRAALGALPVAAAAFPQPASARSLPKGEFTHGVASGDPLTRSVILWTRFVSANAAPARIFWEVAEDNAFTRIAARGDAIAGPATDFCAKVEARGLKPGRWYFYRFLAADGPSVTGQTRTAPDGAVEALTLALFSCSNLPFGYFSAYAHAAARPEVDLCVHVGDYIYEYQRGKYPDAADIVAGRVIEPAGEIIRLNDYYARYASYRADPDLQELHRVKPWAVIWDDHELANDTWRDGAQEHDPATEGAWVDRRAAAAKAYFDWMPIRPDARDPLRTYRTLEWGDLASIVLLDTRLIGRVKQLDIEGALRGAMDKDDAGFMAAVEAYRPTLNDPARTLLGPAQERWSAAQLERSAKAGKPWQIIAQQLVMGQRLASAEQARFLPETASEQQKQRFAFRARLAGLGLESWGDSWAGYPAARARLLADCANRANNSVVLAGDTHNAWACALPGGPGNALAAVEVGCAGVSSPGMERTFRNATAEERAASVRRANPEVSWCDVTNRGYSSLRFTKDRLETDFVAFDNVLTRDAPVKSVTRGVVEASPGRGIGGWTFD